MTSRLKTIQRIPAGINEVWDYFSCPANLKEITPPHLDFKILSHIPQKLEAGLIIKYYIRPILKLRLLWETEITRVRDRVSFTDIQRKGPYKLWRHKHLFREIPGGVEMQDVVDYEVPFGLLGRMLNKLFGKWQHE